MPPIEQDRNPVEALADDFARRYRAGETPSISEYTAQHPELADEIRELFPSVVVMERLKQQKREDQRASEGDLGDDAIPYQQLGDFRILREVGRGGMGIVYEAEQISLRRCVALKVLPTQLTSSRRLKRFRREAKSAARLHHTNIVPVFGVGEHNGIHFYVMQFIRGQCLDHVLEALAICDERTNSSDHDADSLPMAEAFRMAESLKSGLFGPEADAPPVCTAAPSESTSSGVFSNTESATLVDTQAPIATPLTALHASREPYWQNLASIGLQVARALAYAHDQGVLHRDIKPSNLIMDWQGRVWVTDFGLAKHTEHNDITMPGDVVGTVRYMAPERFSGDCDQRSEIYSLGLVLYELATLRPAFDQLDRASLIKAICESSPPRPASIHRTIPRDLETIIQKSIERDPRSRYKSAADMAEDFQRFLDDRAILARRAGKLEILWRWTRRNPATAISMALVLLLLLTVAVISSTGYYFRSKSLRTIRAQKETLSAQSEELKKRNVELINAGKATAKARETAEGNLQFALQAFREILQQVARPGPTSLADQEDWESFPLQTNVTEKDAVLLQSLLKFYDQLAQTNDRNLKPEQARAHRLVGDVHQQIGQFGEAIKAYLSAQRSYLQLAQSDPMYRLEAAAAMNQRGIAMRRLGRLEAARREHQRALEYLEQSPASLKSAADCQFELAQSYASLAKVDSLLQRSAQGPRRYMSEMRDSRKQALKILNQLIEAHPDQAEYRLALARIFSDLPGLDRLTGKRPDRDEMRAMEQSIRQAIEELQKLHEKYPDNPLYKYELAQAYALPFISRVMHFAPHTLANLQRSLTMLEELIVLYPNVPDYKATLARHQLTLARVKWRMGNRDEARVLQQQSLELHAQLLKVPGARGHFWMLISDVRRFADERFRNKDYAAARQILELTLTQLKQSIRELPEAGRVGIRRDDAQEFLKRRLLPYYKLLSDVYRAQGEIALARENDEEARRLQNTIPIWRRIAD